MTHQPDIRPYRGKRPQIAASAYIDPAAVIIGDVVIGEDSSVWPCSVVRGDVHYIRIGARTNIQDGSVLHVMRDEYPLILGDDVTIGHSVTLHGCTIESRCLIGMGAALWNSVESAAHIFLVTLGFGEIRVPVFERIELCARAVGGETDIVSKEMYRFESSAVPDLALIQSYYQSSLSALYNPPNVSSEV